MIQINMKKYDYLVVGSGLFGAVFAHEMKKRGKDVIVLEKRSHVGENIFTKEIEGIQVHMYGAHIFHTSDEKIWQYVNSFVPFNRFTNSPIAIYKDEIYNLPFNMNTFHTLWNVKTPQEAKIEIQRQKGAAGVQQPTNLEEQAISLVGTDIYQKLIKGYTRKQWGRDCKELRSFIIQRLPVRFTYDNNYFNDRFQGIPIGGYTKMIEKMLDGIDVKLETDFLEFKQEYLSSAGKVVYTGPIDAFYKYIYGPLEYRSLRFETEVLDENNFQGNAVVNYTDEEIPWTRIIEHKHFEFGDQPKTVITREYPQEWRTGDDVYYPINDEKNQALYMQYKKLAENENNIIFGGRLGQYKYYDMHQVIAEAMSLVKQEETND